MAPRPSSVVRLLFSEGAIAQLGERVLCKHEVVGSIPSGSTIWRSDDGDRRTDRRSRRRVFWVEGLSDTIGFRLAHRVGRLRRVMSAARFIRPLSSVLRYLTS